MSEIRQYVNNDGYCIRATPKAYEMYYRKLGFRPADVQPDAPESCFAGMKTAELKKYLTDRGITFPAKAKREELEAIAASVDALPPFGDEDADNSEEDASGPDTETEEMR